MIGLGTRSENWERDWLLTYVLGDILGDRPHRSVIEAATNESMTLLVQGGIYVLSFWGGANAHAPPSRRIGASHPVALLSSALEACDARAMLVHIHLCHTTTPPATPLTDTSPTSNASSAPLECGDHASNPTCMSGMFCMTHGGNPIDVAVVAHLL